MIFAELMQKDYQNKLDKDEDETENPHLRRVYQVLCQKSQLDSKTYKE